MFLLGTLIRSLNKHFILGVKYFPIFMLCRHLPDQLMLTKICSSTYYLFKDLFLRKYDTRYMYTY